MWTKQLEITSVARPVVVEFIISLGPRPETRVLGLGASQTRGSERGERDGPRPRPRLVRRAGMLSAALLSPVTAEAHARCSFWELSVQRRQTDEHTAPGAVRGEVRADRPVLPGWPSVHGLDVAEAVGGARALPGESPGCRLSSSAV